MRELSLYFSHLLVKTVCTHAVIPRDPRDVQPGDTITSHDGWQMQVEEVKEENGLLTYIGTRTDTEESGVALREVFLDSKLVFSKPQDRLFAGRLTVWTALRCVIARVSIPANSSVCRTAACAVSVPA